MDKTWGLCSTFADRDFQAAIEDCGSGDGNSVSTFGRPPHPSTLQTLHQSFSLPNMISILFRRL
jgi:hypothetical protein